MKKETKKKLTVSITIGIALLGLGTLSYKLFKKNQMLSGVIRNQQLTIDGMTREVKNLSYQLGKLKSNKI